MKERKVSGDGTLYEIVFVGALVVVVAFVVAVVVAVVAVVVAVVIVVVVVVGKGEIEKRSVVVVGSIDAGHSHRGLLSFRRNLLSFSHLLCLLFLLPPNSLRQLLPLR